MGSDTLELGRHPTRQLSLDAMYGQGKGIVRLARSGKPGSALYGGSVVTDLNVNFVNLDSGVDEINRRRVPAVGRAMADAPAPAAASPVP